MYMSHGCKGYCGRPTAVTNLWDVPLTRRTSYDNERSNRGSPSPHCGACVSPRGLVDNMYDSVQVDEKWFYIMKNGTGVYLQPVQNNLKHLRTQNKRFFTEFMHLASVTRPRKICNGGWFDGKIGIWPVVDIVLAKKDNNKKNPQGTPITKPTTINEESTRSS
ncbi:unnamed protein product [Discosporangium mesarthrocarpum]